MNPYRLCYFSATAMEIPSLSQGIELFQKSGCRITVTARTQSQLFDDARGEAFVLDALASDAVIITLHGGKASCPAFDRLTEALQQAAARGDRIPYLHVQPVGDDEDAWEAARVHSTDFGKTAWDMLSAYWINGGGVNFYNLLICLGNVLFTTDNACEPPQKLRHEGIYHPDMQSQPDLDTYLTKRFDPERITVGLWFNQSYWVNNNLAYIDALIHAVEARGANVIPVFHLRYKDAVRGNAGADEVAARYFKDRIDVLLNPLMFSLTLAAPEYRNLLGGLDVPCIQALTTMQPCAVWESSVQGLSSMEVSFCAAQPEFDGNLITVPVATREESAVCPLTGALLTKHMPIPERVEKIVSLALRWARLRKKKNREKRIAIVFHHYPPRNDRIGCAAGLDSFASIKLLLDAMAERGYQIAQQVESGQALGISEDSAMADFDAFLERLHSYLSDMSDTMIADGLHTLGSVPEHDRLVEFLVQLTRLPNSTVPSLRESLLTSMGYDLDELQENRGRTLPHFKDRTGGEIIRSAHETALQLVGQLAEHQFQPDMVDTIVLATLGRIDPAVSRVLLYIAESLVPNIRRTVDEIENALTAFDGRFVPPGPSGAPSRGQADILPTGRNFYSVDPQKIPSPGAWEVGKRLGDALLERYLQENDSYPESIGIILFGGSTMRSKGDDVAEILYLMGVKPVWRRGSGNVKGLELIPAEALKRPRLDVVPRISGFFRDAFPNLVELIDEAANMVAALNEPPEINMLRRNVLKDKARYEKEGMDSAEAWREATFRVFGCPPGTYGAGVEELVESKNWETQEDLADNYIRYSAHAYGKGSYGQQRPAAFRSLLSRMDVTVKNEDSREYDMLSCTDYYNYYGGLIVAAKSVRGSLPFAMMGDSSDPRRVRMRSTFEEAKHVFRARLLNPKWLDGLKRHGYKGAGDISKMMDVVLGWDATAEVVEDWMYDRLAQKYALDPEMQEWMKAVNPYALQNILDKLLEAISRGMWQADAAMEQELRNAYLDIEGEIEEITE